MAFRVNELRAPVFTTLKRFFILLFAGRSCTDASGRSARPFRTIGRQILLRRKRSLYIVQCPSFFFFLEQLPYETFRIFSATNASTRTHLYNVWSNYFYAGVFYSRHRCVDIILTLERRRILGVFIIAVHYALLTADDLRDFQRQPPVFMPTFCYTGRLVRF